MASTVDVLVFFGGIGLIALLVLGVLIYETRD